MNVWNNLITWADQLAIIFAFFSMLYAGKNYYKNKKQEEKLNQNIHITLTCPQTGASHTLKQTIKRRYASRAEIQGLLANVYQEDKRYNIPYMGKANYSAQIEAIQNGNSDTLTIEIDDPNEYQKFLT